jgi:hypothetical protein
MIALLMLVCCLQAEVPTPKVVITTWTVKDVSKDSTEFAKEYTLRTDEREFVLSVGKTGEMNKLDLQATDVITRKSLHVYSAYNRSVYGYGLSHGNAGFFEEPPVYLLHEMISRHLDSDGLPNRVRQDVRRLWGNIN